MVMAVSSPMPAFICVAGGVCRPRYAIRLMAIAAGPLLAAVVTATLAICHLSSQRTAWQGRPLACHDPLRCSQSTGLARGKRRARPGSVRRRQGTPLSTCCTRARNGPPASWKDLRHLAVFLSDNSSSAAQYGRRTVLLCYVYQMDIGLWYVCVAVRLLIEDLNQGHKNILYEWRLAQEYFIVRRLQ
jgi:hypothetical protein